MVPGHLCNGRKSQPEIVAQIILLLVLSTEIASRVCVLIPKAKYRTGHLKKFFSWPLVCSMLATEKVVNSFICDES